MKTKIVCAVLLGALLVLGAGCSSYYKISDPGSDKIYYSKDLDRNKNGSVVFEDANSGSTVTLQSSNVQKIKKDEFRANTPHK